ncbi:response regulator with -like receiver domain protein and winged-helix dna-binding domain protein [Leptolyngbya sp. Heron Island J]|uniref:response regulator transcription factor n=1 Tax=Leptolyngbya sp. Heron Island J TaxID=1385935 RepID=UPI0003B95A6E|nr:response regulator transcription factor [Leptolyngbya sp. Heron Island J]ESA36974.1 response regulator with -like receiver domain protein and winged-helix dna-binding domain protein [Leptolyngbya sp. Heron Island J]
MRLLLVEDDIQLAESLTEILEAQHYVVDTVKDGEAGWCQMQLMDYDLTLLDVTLPYLDGIQLCQRLRSRGYELPVLMLTARDTSQDKVRGLDSGADAYMVKPFDLSELLAQIRALLRRGNSHSSVMLSWENLSLDPSTYEVSYDQQPLRLTPKEFSILELLMRNGRRVLSRAFILESLWSMKRPPDEETVKAHIKSLRNKLKTSGAPKTLIETVHGVGYRLQGP